MKQISTLFLVLFIALIVWLIVAAIQYFAPPIVEWGRLSTDQEVEAIIVRDEQVIVSGEYGKFESIAGESEYVEQGNEVAVLFNQNYSEADVDMLISVQQNIKNSAEAEGEALTVAIAESDVKMRNLLSTHISQESIQKCTAKVSLVHDITVLSSGELISSDISQIGSIL